MGTFGLLALLSALFMAVALDSNDEAPVSEDTDPPAEPEPTPDPDVVLDTGATFERTEDGVTIDVGDDETGTVVALFYMNYGGDDVHPTIEVDEARFYLVPEGVDWSSASDDPTGTIPGLDTFDGSDEEYGIEEFAAANGLELLGTVDLTNTYNSIEHDYRIGEVTSNEPIGFYGITAYPGHGIYSFSTADPYVPPTYGDSLLSDTTGTDGTDWYSANADDITVDGAGGNDHLYTDNDNVHLIGGDGDDIIRFTGADDVVNAGDGDDEIYAWDQHNIYGYGTGIVHAGAGDDTVNIREGTAYGGEGNDRLQGNAHNNYDSASSIYGQAGDDFLRSYGDQAEAHGGDGDDFIGVDNGATGYGDDGNDILDVGAGSTAYGGDGDDTFTIWNQFRDDAGPAVVTGGAGADTFDVRVWNALNGEADDIFLTITDFDPAEDVLQVGVFQTSNEVDSVQIVEAPDSSYTDVRVTYTPLYGYPAGTAIIRLEGTTGVTTDHIVITS